MEVLKVSEGRFRLPMSLFARGIEVGLKIEGEIPFGNEEERYAEWVQWAEALIKSREEQYSKDSKKACK